MQSVAAAVPEVRGADDCRRNVTSDTEACALQKPSRGWRAGLAILVAATLFHTPASAAAEMTRQRADGHTISGLPVPLEIRSSYSGERAAGEVSGVLAIGYLQVQQALADPAAWCDFLTLHINVKACVHGRRDDQTYLRVFGGTKEFERLETAQEIEWTFVLPDRSAAHTEVVLRASHGPMGTSNYYLGVTLEPVGDTATAVHLVYRYELGLGARIALAGYLKTVARDKVGFSVVDTVADGAARYVGGVRGMTERNVVRYYLALIAYFDRAADERFVPAAGAQRWFDLTARYPTQLAEVPRDAYLDAKRREYAQQRALQQALDLH